jgi:hypothetical protein
MGIVNGDGPRAMVMMSAAKTLTCKRIRARSIAQPSNFEHSSQA